MAVEKQTDEAAPSPTTKKQKTMVEQAPDSEWPAAWLMPEGDCENQKAKNMREPNVPVTVAELKDIGIWWVLLHLPVLYSVMIPWWIMFAAVFWKKWPPSAFFSSYHISAGNDIRILLINIHYFSAHSYWKLDASAYDYPVMSVPWDPKDAVDPKLSQIRGEFN